MTILTERFTHAVGYARVAHATQVRKGTRIPCLSHLLAVARLVIEHGGSEDQAIAGLLHDTIEDCGHAQEAAIRVRFGDAVAQIVLACTGGTAEAKSAVADAEARRHDWQAGKQYYLARLADAPDHVLLVSACDKLHNARAVVRDLEYPAVGPAVFERLTGAWRGRSCVTARWLHCLRRGGSVVARELAGTVRRMERLLIRRNESVV